MHYVEISNVLCNYGITMGIVICFILLLIVGNINNPHSNKLM